MVDIKIGKTGFDVEILHDGKPVAGVQAMDIAVRPDELVAVEASILVNSVIANVKDPNFVGHLSVEMVDELSTLPIRTLRTMAAEIFQLANDIEGL